MSYSSSVSRLPTNAHLTDPKRASTQELAAWPLLVLAAALFLTNPWFTFHDDEIGIVEVADLPVLHTLSLFFRGYGYHKHPVLSDLILHGWMVVTKAGLPWLRLPFILFFVAGLWFLTRVARMAAGPVAGRALIWIGALWPYGFHYGRLAGWYTLTFFLTSLLTWAYFRFLQSPSYRLWSLTLVAGVALLYTNYFGWAIVACLAADWQLRRGHPRPHGWHILDRTPLGTLILLGLAFLPLLPAFFALLFTPPVPGRGFLRTAVYAGYDLYLLFVSEAAAPWIPWVGISVGGCIVLCLALVAFAARGEGRRFFLYFLCLMTGMALLRILTHDRAISIAPWLLLSLAVTLASIKNQAGRRCLVGALSVIAGIGWLGIVTGRYYAAPTSRAPWQAVAQQSATNLRQGAEVIGDNLPFFFYLTYALQAPPEGSSAPASAWRFIGTLPGGVRYPGVYDPIQWFSEGRPVRPVTILVRGVPMLTPVQASEQTEKWLDQSCRLLQLGPRLADPNFALKERHAAQNYHYLETYLEVREYNCRQTP